MTTQLQSAREGKITEQMRSVSQGENLEAEFVQEEVSRGRLVIPANKFHIKTNLKPRGIGRVLSIKVNANIGTSSVSSSVENELEKMETAIEAGADAIMD